MSSSNDDDDDVKFPPVTDIDPNVWYHLTEFRVDTYGKSFTSNFHIDGDGELRVLGILKKQTWQFHPVNATIGRYSLRHNFMGVYKQLAVCYDPTEASVGKTKPCLLDSVPGEQAQMWDVADWGDGMVRFINVGNGTKYWLDVHQGNPPFMSSSTDMSDDNPAQRWLYTSVSDVNDAAYSTVFSAVCVPYPPHLGLNIKAMQDEMTDQSKRVERLETQHTATQQVLIHTIISHFRKNR